MKESLIALIFSTMLWHKCNISVVIQILQDYAVTTNTKEPHLKAYT